MSTQYFCPSTVRRHGELNAYSYTSASRELGRVHCRSPEHHRFSLVDVTSENWTSLGTAGIYPPSPDDIMTLSPSAPSRWCPRAAISPTQVVQISPSRGSILSSTPSIVKSLSDEGVTESDVRVHEPSLGWPFTISTSVSRSSQITLPPEAHRARGENAPRNGNGGYTQILGRVRVRVSWASSADPHESASRRSSSAMSADRTKLGH
ncbi:hypothetical protein C8R46DRAFT_475052 [Mycena filopes]|nr:hypothetical protein C8R46DRAFT_475052 [Mycena filopes]